MKNWTEKIPNGPEQRVMTSNSQFLHCHLGALSIYVISTLM